jgi:hypothetical protein
LRGDVRQDRGSLKMTHGELSLPASCHPHFSDDNENLPEHRHGVKDYFPIKCANSYSSRSA